MCKNHNIVTYCTEVLHEIASVTDLKQLKPLFSHYLGKESFLGKEFTKLSTLPLAERRAAAMQLNKTQQEIKRALLHKQEALQQLKIQQDLEKEELDITLPVRPYRYGKKHLISQTIEEVKEIFCTNLGFELVTGPDIEDTYHVFDALNTPLHHPARQLHDSFYLQKNSFLLRSHTSSVQVRAMEQCGAPLCILSIGRVYRQDADSTHTPMFHQVEGLYLDTKVTMGHLRFCLEYFLNNFFTNKVVTRFRGSFFPFTEPSLEVDIKDPEINDDKSVAWLEVLGCGMVHKNVLRSSNIDTNKYQGFAFGVGVERITMLKHDIRDIRMFFNNDLSWLEYYGSYL